MSDVLLGIDLGTSSVKAVFFDISGVVLGMGSEEYSVSSPLAGWSEQDPDLWWSSTRVAVHKALSELKQPHKIRGIGLSGQMHGLVCLDKEKKVLRPAMLWADQRSGEEAERINTFLDEHCFFERALNKASSGFLFASLLWLMEHEPDVARRISHILLPKDYLRFCLTGEIATEKSDACGTGMFDVVNGTWLDEPFRHFAISREALPAVLDSFELAGVVSSYAADTLGIEKGIPVAAGAGDQAAQALGNGLICPGQASSNIGTAGQFFVATETPLFDPELRCNCFNHAYPGLWYLLGANLSAGFALKWLWRKIIGREDYTEAVRLAEKVPAGSRGLLFHPYLNGDRTPHQNPEASASFIGLGSTHGLPEMVRAVMEGVVFSMREGLEVARSMGISPKLIIASGGGARSSLWRQIQADIYGTPVTTTASTEQACAGAAILAGVVSKVFDSPEEACRAMVRQSETLYEPNPRNVAIYEDMYILGYRDFYRNNRQLYTKLFQWRTERSR